MLFLKKPIPLISAVVMTVMMGTSGAVPQEGDDKVTNQSGNLKEAFRSLDVNSSTADLSLTETSTKIAQLDTSELKEVGGAEQPVLAGDFTQGGLILGKTVGGSTVTLDDIDVDVDEEGRFVFGFHRDHPDTAVLKITYPDGTILTPQTLTVASREFMEQSIDGLPSNKVNKFTPEEEQKIVADLALKKEARANMQSKADWVNGFDWPVKGPISGVFGSQRILNGVPRRPHSGVDVAVPVGTDVRAPGDGIITLAENDMYFEGGLVFIDHGQGLESALMHMSRIDVEAGQRVAKGDVIGAVGATGRATGPHMHWSLKWKDRLLDAQLVVPEMTEEG